MDTLVLWITYEYFRGVSRAMIINALNFYRYRAPLIAELIKVVASALGATIETSKPVSRHQKSPLRQSAS